MRNLASTKKGQLQVLLQLIDMIDSNVRNLILQPEFNISAFRAGSEDAYFSLKGEVL